MEKQSAATDDVEQWHLREIRAGIAEADAGLVIDHSKLRAMVPRWRSQIDRAASRDYFEES